MENQQQKMNRKSKVLIVVMFILIGLSIAFTFYRTIVIKDYPVIEKTL